MKNFNDLSQNDLLAINGGASLHTEQARQQQFYGT